MDTYFKKFLCKMFNHNWGDIATWYTFLGVPYDHRTCKRCGVNQIVKVYAKEMESERVEYNKKQGL